MPVLMVTPQETTTSTYVNICSTFVGSGDQALEQLQPVVLVENVLCPLSVALTGVSNVTLLAHEACVVWRTRRVTPPKLLVLALASADTLATLIGFLPLWILSVAQYSAYNPSSCPATGSYQLASDYQLLVPTEFGRANESEGSTSPPPGGNSYFEGLRSAGYSLCLFLLTTFWTLAQCIVVVMGIERFLALRAPFFYTGRCTCEAFLLTLAGLGLLSGAVAGVHVAVHTQEMAPAALSHPLLFAGFMESKSLALNALLIAQGLAWTLVLLLCNWAVTRELRRMERRVTVMRAKDQGEYLKQLSLVHGSGREFARLMMAVNALFVTSSCPHLVSLVVRLCQRRPSFSVQYFCWRMSHLPALVNPFLYGFLRRSLRSRIRRSLEQHFLCARSNRVGDTGAHAQTVHYKNAADLPSAIVPQDPEASTVHISG